MVRGRYVRKRDGTKVWREWSPDACPAGHTTLRPTWTALPCGCMGRAWDCGSCDGQVVDPDHRCQGQRR